MKSINISVPIRVHPLLCLAVVLLSATLARAQSGQLQYWFDTYSGVKTTSLSGTTTTADLNTNGLSQGFHTLCMRVKQSGNVYSPVYTATFFKFPAAESSNIEYWFDDNYEQKATMPVNVETGTLQKLDLDMTDAVKFPLGFHRLNMRIAAGSYSPVYTAYVMRLADGRHSELTYWLDDDYAGRRVVKGNPVNNVITSMLDFSSTPSGLHRLKYRITTKGFDDGVVYEEPILVTRLYNNQADVTIVKEAHWLDEVTGLPADVSNPQPVITKGYTLYASNYTTGQHVFYVQYRNSSGVWSEPNATYFYKEASGKLKIGRRPGDATGIDNAELADQIRCTYHDGTLYVDCQSSKLASTGMIIVCDQTGKVVAQQTVNSSDGIHAELNVRVPANQLLFVRLVSGDLQVGRKVVVR